MASNPALADAPPDREDMSQQGAPGIQPESQPSAMPDQQEQSKGLVSAVKQVSTGIEDLARQFPAGAKEFKGAQDKLIEAMQKVLSNMKQKQSGAAPAG
jgi:hypothetical protein